MLSLTDKEITIEKDEIVELKEITENGVVVMITSEDEEFCFSRRFLDMCFEEVKDTSSLN